MRNQTLAIYFTIPYKCGTTLRPRGTDHWGLRPCNTSCLPVFGVQSRRYKRKAWIAAGHPGSYHDSCKSVRLFRLTRRSIEPRATLPCANRRQVFEGNPIPADQPSYFRHFRRPPVVVVVMDVKVPRVLSLLAAVVADKWSVPHLMPPISVSPGLNHQRRLESAPPAACTAWQLAANPVNVVEQIVSTGILQSMRWHAGVHCFRQVPVPAP